MTKIGHSAKIGERAIEVNRTATQDVSTTTVLALRILFIDQILVAANPLGDSNAPNQDISRNTDNAQTQND
jgi:hypothetical protein